MNGPIEVYLAQDRLDARMAQAFLKARGVEAHIVGEDVQDNVGWEIGGLGSVHTKPSLWVRPDDADEARELIREFESERRAASPADDDPGDDPWRCDGCSEMIEAQFSACWNCGADRA